MSLFKIAWRSIQQRGMASALTGLSMALGVALVVAVLVIHAVVADSFKRNAGLGYDLIIGAKGGKLQLVLNTVYHLSSPVENIPYSLLKDFTDGKYKPYVEKAIPYCLGDNYEGYRVVATVPGLFDGESYAPGKPYAFAQGRNFKKDAFFEGVAGALAARRLGLKVGDTFRPAHGVVADGQGMKHDAFTVVGILEPTGTANDRALFINMEGFYLLENHAKPVEEGKDTPKPSAVAKKEDHDDHDHDHDHTSHALPEGQRELTAILIRTSSASLSAGIFLPNLINEGNQAQAVLPAREIRGLFDAIVEPIQWLLLGLTVLIVIVSGIGILVSIYNSMTERRREIAVMRALGARRGTVMAIVLLESILLSLGGGAVGWLLGRGLIAALSPIIVAQTGVSIGLAPLMASELLLIPGLVVLATLVGYLPAMSAYRTDVARALASAP
jgi:putative ABC transport system permease protein